MKRSLSLLLLLLIPVLAGNASDVTISQSVKKNELTFSVMSVDEITDIAILIADVTHFMSFDTNSNTFFFTISVKDVEDGQKIIFFIYYTNKLVAESYTISLQPPTRSFSFVVAPETVNIYLPIILFNMGLIFSLFNPFPLSSIKNRIIGSSTSWPMSIIIN